MSLAPSTTLIESTLDLYTGGTPYLALYTTNPTAADIGTEVTGGSYSRKAITFGSTSGGARSNTASISFPGLPAATITHYGIRSASTGGTLRAFGPLNSSMVAVSGDEVTFAVGAVEISLAGS
jgi:hypothetical protein